MKTFLMVLILTLAANSAFALEVVYSNKVTTNFKWKWPYQTRQTTGWVQTRPYYYAGRIIDMSQEDVSQYRFHHSYLARKNAWGYFFKPGTKLSPQGALFGTNR